MDCKMATGSGIDAVRAKQLVKQNKEKLNKSIIKTEILNV